MRQFARYKVYMGITILCGVIFLVVKLAYEWPQKFDHFGAYIKKSALEKYEPYLGNNICSRKGLPPRIEITGHLHNHEALHDANIKEYEIALDPVNADPTNPAMDRPHFLYVPPTEKIAKIEKEDVERATMFCPAHSAYFASYFTITGLARIARARRRARLHLYLAASRHESLQAQIPSISPIELRSPGCSGTL